MPHDSDSFKPAATRTTYDGNKWHRHNTTDLFHEFGRSCAVSRKRSLSRRRIPNRTDSASPKCVQKGIPMGFDFIWKGNTNVPQPPTSPATGLDNAGNIFYVNSQSLPTAPSVWVPIGGGPGGGPIIQARLQAVNTTVPQSLTITAPASVMYAVSLFLETAGTFGSGHTVIATLVWGSPLAQHTITLTLPMDAGDTIIMETYPLLVAAGAPISISTAFGGGATADTYTISARLVQMP